MLFARETYSMTLMSEEKYISGVPLTLLQRRINLTIFTRSKTYV
jgi:hypothetical protein